MREEHKEIRPEKAEPEETGLEENGLGKTKPEKVRPEKTGQIGAVFLLCGILAGCFAGSLFLPENASYMNQADCNLPPCRKYPFGTDALGRDLFLMIWNGGRISLSIGFLSTVFSTAIAVVLGVFSGLSAKWVDGVLMWVTDILLSIPGLLLLFLWQGIFGKNTVTGLSFAIGSVSWMQMAKVIRTQVRELGKKDYILAARAMGGGFFHILRKHLTPDIVSSIMFMVVMNIRSAMMTEATLSFMGIGLSLEQISWGSMLSIAQRAFFTSSWWVIVIPGIFLVVTLCCITAIGNAFRREVNLRHSNL